MEPIEYERVTTENDYAVRRIEALTSALRVIEQGFWFPPPTYSVKTRLERGRAVKRIAKQALDPDYLSHDG